MSKREFEKILEENENQDLDFKKELPDSKKVAQLVAAKRDLMDLKEKNIIKFVGSAKTGYYCFYDTVNDAVNDTVNKTKN